MKITDKQWIKLMEMGQVLGCHQMPERSFFVKGYQLPICARCTGVLVSTVIALLVFFKKRLPITVCIAMSNVMLVDWGLQYLEIKESTNTRRLLSGIIGGFGYSTLHLYFYYFLFIKTKELLKYL